MGVNFGFVVQEQLYNPDMSTESRRWKHCGTIMRRMIRIGEGFVVHE